MRRSGDGVHGEEVSYSNRTTVRGVERGFCVAWQLGEVCEKRYGSIYLRWRMRGVLTGLFVRTCRRIGAAMTRLT